MKILNKLLLLLLCAMITISLASCDAINGILGDLGLVEDGENNEEEIPGDGDGEEEQPGDEEEEAPHQHTFADVWSVNDTHHWYAATCGHDSLKMLEALHEYVDGVCICGAEEPIIPHEHAYEAVVTAPTCISEGYTTYTCECGHSYTDDIVEMLEHTFEAVVTAPTCTAGGYTTYTCQCGESYSGDDTAALGHSYETVVTAPTCILGGYTTSTCSACGDSSTYDEVAALGHNHVTTVVEPTCTTVGYTVHTCACGDTYTDEEKVPVIPHTYEVTSIIAPSCTEAGYSVYTCSVCGDSYNGDETAALGHTEEAVAGTAADCTNTGLTDGTKCSVCGEPVVAQDVIPALGHTEEAILGYAATCTAEGLTDGARCSVCGETITAQEVIPATGHSFATEWTVEGDYHWRAAICGDTEEKADYAEHSYNAEDGYCVCGKHDGIHRHKYTAVVTEPTCKDGGYTTYTCECSDSYIADETPVGNNHSWEADENPYDTIEVGCTVCGCVQLTYQNNFTTGTRVSYSEDEAVWNENGVTVIVGKGGASAVTEYEKGNRTRLANGNTITFKLDNGGLIYKVVWQMPYGGLYTNGVTAYEAGYSTLVTSADCAITWSWEGENNPAFITFELNEPATEFTFTSISGYTYFDYVQLIALKDGEGPHKHAYTESVTPSTCTEAGSIDYACSCGYSYSEAIPTHNWVEDTNEEDKVLAVCSSCGYAKYEDSMIFSQFETDAETGAMIWHQDGSTVTTVFNNNTLTNVNPGRLDDDATAVITVNGGMITKVEWVMRGVLMNSWSECGGNNYLKGVFRVYDQYVAGTLVATEGATVTFDSSAERNNTIVTIEFAAPVESVTIANISDGRYYTFDSITVTYIAEAKAPANPCDHVYEATVVAPTCTEAGYTNNICSVCGDSYISDETPALGHTYSEEWTFDEGAHWHASTCGHDVVDGKAEHSLDSDGSCEVCDFFTSTPSLTN